MALPQQILPGTGRWQRAALTEGVRLTRLARLRTPSTKSRGDLVPLPIPGRT
jgi:hypothetical protein